MKKGKIEFEDPTFRANELYEGDAKPFDMILSCPECGMLHVDEPEPDVCQDCHHAANRHPFSTAQIRCHCVDCPCIMFFEWTNPPHKSHLCHCCGTIWRPSDVPTNGVASIKTKGKADTWRIGEN